MERLLVAVALIGIVAAVAAVVRSRATPSAPTRTGHTVPDQLDRDDFDRPDAPWLVVEFSSRTCLSCAGTWEKVAVLVADADGVVQASFLGPPTAADLWAKLAELRT